MLFNKDFRARSPSAAVSSFEVSVRVGVRCVVLLAAARLAEDSILAKASLVSLFLWQVNFSLSL